MAPPGRVWDISESSKSPLRKYRQPFNVTVVKGVETTWYLLIPHQQAGSLFEALWTLGTSDLMTVAQCLREFIICHDVAPCRDDMAHYLLNRGML
jgi:hypothetical protein